MSNAVSRAVRWWRARRTTAEPVANARRDIQGLRALAVVAVILDHVLRWPDGGFVGVDVFFVISGYLITALLLREHDRTGTISAKGFYARRIKRVVPAAVTVLYTTVVVSVLALGAQQAKQTLVDAVWALFFAANWRFVAQSTDYFQQGQLPSPLQHYWSLGVEEQFYLVWPWLLLLLFAIGARWFRWSGTHSRVVAGVAIAVIGAASFAWALHATEAQPSAAYFSSLTRAWELGLGALVAVLAPVFARLPGPVRPVLTYAGLAGIVGSMFVVKEDVGFPAPWAALPVVATAVVIVAGEGAQVRAWPLTSGVANYLGDISYSLYLWHFPVAILLESYLLPDSAAYIATALTLVLVLSVASFHLLEDPIRKSTWLDGRWSLRRFRRGFWGQQQGYLLLAASSLALVVFAGTALQSPTPPASSFQLSAAAEAGGSGYQPKCYGAVAEVQPKTCASVDGEGVYPAPESLRDDSSVAYRCFNQYDAVHFKSCDYGDASGKLKIAVVGDSHMAQWLAGLDETAQARGWHLVSYVGQGCAWGDSGSCPSWSKVMRKIRTGGYDALVTSDYRRNFGDDREAAAERAADAFADAGKVPMVVIGDVPQVSDEAMRCVSRRTVSPDDDCSTPRSDALELSDPLEDAAKEAGEQFVSMNDVICPKADDGCPAIMGHVLVYRDELAHLSDTYSETIGSYLGARLEKRFEKLGVTHAKAGGKKAQAKRGAKGRTKPKKDT